MSYRSILVALSGVGNEELVVQEAFKLKEAFNAELTVIHINSTHAGEMSMMMDSSGHRFTESEIKSQISNYGFSTDDVKIIIDTAEYIQRALAKYANKADLLILCHVKMSSFKEQFFDSVDEGIVNNVSCPVLVIPKPK